MIQGAALWGLVGALISSATALAEIALAVRTRSYSFH